MNLDGIRILDLTRYLPGPYGTQLLADMGADVIKIERRGTGDPAREAGTIEENGQGEVFNAVNRGKRSLTLDLKTDAGLDVLYRLTADVDIVFEQFRPGVAERLGIGFEDIREHNPSIIYCSLSGYGQQGPDSNYVGHDLNYLGDSGFLDMNRPDSGTDPILPPYPVGDMAGGLFAAFAILGSLLSRELGNQDQADYIDVSITDVMLSFAQTNIPKASRGERQRPGSTRLTGKYPCYNVYQTADGAYVTLAALEEKFWNRFCDALNRPDLKPHHLSDDRAIRDEVESELATEFTRKEASTWLTELDRAEIPIGPVLDQTQALENPQIESRKIRQEGTGCGARISFPAVMSTTMLTDEHPPKLGEHTDEILAEFGYSTSTIAALEHAEII